MNPRKAGCFLVLLLMACAPLALSQGTYTTIDYPGATATVVEGINTAGDMVGYFANSNGFTHGFLLSGGVFTQLDVPGTTNGTLAYGINDFGQVVGGTQNLGLFVYDIPTQTYTLYQYGNGNFVNTTGASINNAGLIVGWTQRFLSGQFAGLELSGSTFTRVTLPNAYSTQLTSINNAGQIVAVTTSVSDAKAAYLIQSGKKLKQIVVPNTPTALAVGINDQGAFTGTYTTRINLGFLWSRPGLEQIHVSGYPNTLANGLNNAAQVVGYYFSNTDPNVHGLLWTPPGDAAKE